MQNEATSSNSPQQVVSENNDFGMTEADVKNYKLQGFFSKIKYYLAAIAPSVTKVLNAIIYYTIKFIKAVVTSVIKMILGKEV